MDGARAMTQNDVGWAASVLARRRAALVPHAPLYWRPAADALERHRAHLAHVIGEGQGVGFRTNDALMVAAKGERGWTIDDAWVQPDRWERDGEELWARTMEHVGTDPVRFVCPVFEPERAAFARQRGLVPESSWWHAEVEALETIRAHDADPHVAGASAALVSAPPIYDPGGPILFLHGVRDITAIAESRESATRCGSPLVVVDQPAGREDLAEALADEGFTRHCDFLVGTGIATHRSSGEGGDLPQVLGT